MALPSLFMLMIFLEMLFILIVGTFSLISGAQGVTPCGRNNLCCNDKETCCPLENGKFGCFSEENAVCCGGSSFACLKNYICHMKFGMCIDWDIVMPPLSPAHDPQTCPSEFISLTNVRDQPCGSSGFCSGNLTCCPHAQPRPACCPLPNGKCCDSSHCCPAGYRCDLVNKGCIKALDFNLMSHRPSILAVSQTSKQTLCPDHTACADNQTCCSLKAGGYGCCPFDKAKCCSDKEHCCPHSFECDLVNQKCTSKTDWLMFVPTTAEKRFDDAFSMPNDEGFKALQRDVKDVVCPDPNYKCADNTTCCYLNSGVYGCCPYPKAVCCRDGSHCCPHGYICDSTHQRCVAGKAEILGVVQRRPDSKEVSAKLMEKHTRIQDVICPDKTSVCSDGTTCCKMSDGSYGCCPYANGTCCADHQHCCPKGFTCDLTHQQCSQAHASKKHVRPSGNTISFVVIETVMDGPTNKKAENIPNEAPLMPPISMLKSVMSLMDHIMNFGSPKSKPVEETEEHQLMQGSCSAVEADVARCPTGTSCCRPPGEQEGPVCCPGHGPVSCCPGGFCCPEGHECHPITLTCHKRPQDDFAVFPGLEQNV